MRDTRLFASAGAFALLALLFPSAAPASGIDLSCGGGDPLEVDDQLAGDDDADPNEIQFDFVCTDPLTLWTGAGRVIGKFGPGGYTLTQLTDFTAQNIGNGPVVGLAQTGFLDITHSFAVFWPGIETFAWLDGYYDNVDGALAIGGADLIFNGYVDGVAIGAIDPPRVDDVPPTVPFFGLEGPVLDPDQMVLEHHLNLVFYLDTTGDAFVLPDSAFTRSAVPEPGAGALLLLGSGLAFALRRRTR
jgi:hypothetical protein